MTTAPATESALLRQSLRDALAGLSPRDEVRRLIADERGWDVATWRRLCGEVGLAGLAVPERYGGAGFGVTELAVAFEEAGRVLLCGPLLSTVGMAVPLLLALGDEAACAEWLPGICDGTLTATVALADTQGRWGTAAEPVTAGERGGEWSVHGTRSFVIDGTTADFVLVPCATERGAAVFAVPAQAIVAEPLVTLDLTRRQATVRFDDAPARLVGQVGQVGQLGAADPLAGALDVTRSLLAAECVGGAQRCLDLTVDHLKNRYQFGRPIGSFQAVKQKAADMLVRVESARSAATEAAGAAAERHPDLPVVAAVAKLYCADAYLEVAAESIQLHGGIGFTWEHDAHLYFKRARTSQELLGGAGEHLEWLAERVDP